MGVVRKTEFTATLKRRIFKLGGLALVGLGLILGCNSSGVDDGRVLEPSNRNWYFHNLKGYYPGTETVADGEMRITFLGTSCIPRLSQAAVSVFVEIGNEARDTFVFDAGAGVVPKYFAMGINFSQMDRIFLAHLHADHMGDMPYIYGFGPSYGRGWPLNLWGPMRSGLIYTDPNGNQPFGIAPLADGTADYADALAKLSVWHNQSQSFLATSYSNYIVPAWGEPGKTDAYDIVTHELNWTKTGFVDAQGKSVPGPAGNGVVAVDDNVAYNYNGVKITHFPAVHTREGSLSFKLEWNGMSMIYSGDTIPNYYMIAQATSGVDVLIHEIVMPAADWAARMGQPASAVTWDQEVQDSSHTPQKAYGYLLSQLKTPPRLAVATHFQATDDTVASALSDIRVWYPKGEVQIASDFLVLNVSKTKIERRQAIVSEYAWPQYTPAPSAYGSTGTPKYWMWVDSNDHSKGVTGDPKAQLDPNAPVIDPSLYNAK
jgi:ribonuclease Z